MAHLARMGFEEKSEEIFAYLLSSSFLQKALGGIIEEEKEVIIFFTFFFLGIICFFISYRYPFFLIGYVGCGLFSFFFLTYGLFRLFKKKSFLRKAAKKLYSILKVKKSVRATLFRMTDQEIKNFSKMDSERIKEYIREIKEKSLRWKMIYLAYFCNQKDNL